MHGSSSTLSLLQRGRPSQQLPPSHSKLSWLPHASKHLIYACNVTRITTRCAGGSSSRILCGGGKKEQDAKSRVKAGRKRLADVIKELQECASLDSTTLTQHLQEVCLFSFFTVRAERKA